MASVESLMITNMKQYVSTGHFARPTINEIKFDDFVL